MDVDVILNLEAPAIPGALVGPCGRGQTGLIRHVEATLLGNVVVLLGHELGDNGVGVGPIRVLSDRAAPGGLEKGDLALVALSVIPRDPRGHNLLR